MRKSQISDLQEKLRKDIKDMRDLIDHYEQKIATMENGFSCQLDEQDNKISELSAELVISKRNNEILDLELRRIKKEV